MEQLVSPDLPAWVCYLIVLLLGTLAARAEVDQLLAAHPDHWQFLNTWLLFGSHALIPVGLFWFLDYTSALHDTSLFGALVVALGYRQIFAGGVQGIQMQGQTPRLWEPYAKWVKNVQARMEQQQRRHSERLDESLRSFIAEGEDRANKLENLAITYSSNVEELARQLAALHARATPTGVTPEAFTASQRRDRVRLLLDDLRKAQPEGYADSLIKNRLVADANVMKIKGLWSKFLGAVFATGLVLAVLLGIFQFQQDSNQLRYHRWRFGKVHVTDWDRFRTEEYLSERLRQAGPRGPAAVAAVLDPLLGNLRYKAIPTDYAERLLRLIVDNHSKPTSRVFLPTLIECLRTENADVRLRIKHAILDLRRADFPNSPLAVTTENWEPSPGEAPGVIDGHVQAFSAWWKAANSPASSQADPGPNPSGQAGKAP